MSGENAPELDCFRPARLLQLSGRDRGPTTRPADVNAVMRAIWSEEQNVADPGVLVVLAERCGLEGR